jgi:hypothetical protein
VVDVQATPLPSGASAEGKPEAAFHPVADAPEIAAAAAEKVTETTTRETAIAAKWVSRLRRIMMPPVECVRCLTLFPGYPPLLTNR